MQKVQGHCQGLYVPQGQEQELHLGPLIVIEDKDNG